MNANPIQLTMNAPEVLRPGHPLVLACFIMRLYPSFADASRINEDGYRAAEADPRVPGEGQQIKYAVDALQVLAAGLGTEAAIATARDSWYRSWAGGRPGLVDRGQAQADEYESDFRALASSWAAA